MEFFNSDDYLTPDFYCRSENWDAVITTIKGKRVVQLRSPDGETRNYRWPNPTIDHAKVLLREAEKVKDFPDIAFIGQPESATSSVEPPTDSPAAPGESSLKNVTKTKEKREQTGWIQKSYRTRVNGKQVTLPRWQPGATGPYYCYRYKEGKRTPGVYLKGDRYSEVLAAIDADKSVVEILRMLRGT